MTCSGNDRVAEELESALLVLLRHQCSTTKETLHLFGEVVSEGIPYQEELFIGRTTRQTKLGTESGLSARVRNLLKTTLGGSFVPSAATARATEKLRFSGTYDLRGTERLPLNSRVRIEARVRRA